MRAVILMSMVVAGSSHEIDADRAAMIETIRSTPGVLWTAGPNPRFAHEPVGASKPLAGVTPAAMAARARAAALLKGGAAVEIPESFDSAEHWPACAKVIDDIRDQSNCGCCWAFAAASAASDRLCIATNASFEVPLSAEDVCFCGSMDGCNGGDIHTPWEHIQKGVVTGGQYHGTGPFGPGFCSDYSLPHCHHHGPQGEDPFPAEGAAGCPSASSPRCPTACDAAADGEHRDFERDKISFEGEIVAVSGADAIAEAIMKGGPVETAFNVFSDFENYVSGIYHHVTGEMAGGHAVRIVGWGVEDGTKYWKVANSWNPYWGEKGYFRIRRGTNEGGIEDEVTASSPAAIWGQRNVGSASIVI
mmetsp:Transcript_107917/g.305094  ORF Transcript_107917/g.305094 Transcript_107917/m.305094 type:complete len:361 (+) Transcript_107917:95-1177(+)